MKSFSQYLRESLSYNEFDPSWDSAVYEILDSLPKNQTEIGKFDTNKGLRIYWAGEPIPKKTPRYAAKVAMDMAKKGTILDFFDTSKDVTEEDAKEYFWGVSYKPLPDYKSVFEEILIHGEESTSGSEPVIQVYIKPTAKRKS